MIDRQSASELIRQFPRSRVLVIGDLILDRYVWGDSERISPEAPVPVVRVEREEVMLGGAGNVARNLASLGAAVEMISVVGEDDTALALRGLCERWKIETRGIVVDPDRPTTEKTRVIARAQQMVRFDRESEEALPVPLVEMLVERVRRAASEAKGAILQDYAKGLLGPEITAELMDTLHAAGVRVFVDPKRGPLGAYAGAELLKPNLKEAEELAGIRARTEADLGRIGAALVEASGAGTIAITRGSAGMTLYARASGARHVPTQPRPVWDVAGAGDTTIAALVLARLADADWIEAAALANTAAGAVVQVPGTATVTPEELLDQVGAP